jgi:hypothetical protein
MDASGGGEMDALNATGQTSSPATSFVTPPSNPPPSLLLPLPVSLLYTPS